MADELIQTIPGEGIPQPRGVAPGPIPEGVIPSPAHFPVVGVNTGPGTQQLNTAAPPAPPPLDTSPSLQERFLSDEQILRRAQRYHELLGGRSPGVNSLAGRLRAPRGEESLREELTLGLQSRIIQSRHRLLDEYIRSRQGSPRQDDINVISSLAGEELERAAGDPRTFFERLNARREARLVPNADVSADRSLEVTMETFRTDTQRITALRDYAHRRLEEINAEFGQRPWYNRAGQYASMFVPFIEWYNLQNQVSRPPAGQRTAGNFMLGGNLQQQAEHYYSLSVDDGARQLDAAIDRIRNASTGNMIQAIAFLEYVSNPTTFGQHMMNLMSGLDVATVLPYRTTGRLIGATRRSRVEPEIATPGVTPPGPGGASPGEISEIVRRARSETDADLAGVAETRTAGEFPGVFVGEPRIHRAARDEARARTDTAIGGAVNPDRPANVFEAAGDIPRAALRSAAEEVAEIAERAGRQASFNDLRNTTRSLFDVEGIIRGSQLNARNELTQRLITNRETLLRTAILDPVDISRLPRGGEAERAAINQAEEILRRQYNHVADRIADVHLTGRGFAELTPEMLPLRIRAMGINAAREYEKAHGFPGFNLYDAYRQTILDRNTIALEISRISGVPAKFNRRRARYEFDRVPMSAIDAARNDELATLRIQLAELDTSLLRVAPNEQRIYNKAVVSELIFRNAARRINFKLDRFGDIPLPVASRLKDMTPADAFSVFKTLGNVRYLEMKILDRDAKFFRSEEAARTQARLDGFRDYRIKRQGEGWYIAVQRPLDETTPWVRQNLHVDVLDRPTPTSRISTFLGYLRSWRYKVNKEIYDDMLVATYGGSYLNQTVGRMISEILEARTVLDKGKDRLSSFPRMSAESQRDFTAFIEGQKTYLNPITMQRGRFSGSQAEFERDWYSRFHRMPDLPESLAYWTYVQINDLNYTMLNLGLYRDKVRQGWEMFSFPVFSRPHALPPPPGRGLPVERYEGPRGRAFPQSQPIEGRHIAEMPPRHTDWSAGILVHDPDPTKSRYFRYGRAGMPGAAQKTIDDAIRKLEEQGYTKIHVAHMSNHDLITRLGYTAEEVAAMPGLTGRAPVGVRGVDFIFAKRVETAPIPFKQIPYRAGGNIEYPHRYFVKMADVRGDTYVSDIVVHGAGTLKEAQDLARRYNYAQELFRAVRAGVGEARRKLSEYLEKNLPYTTEEFEQLFSRRLHDNQPFVAVPASSRTIDVDRAAAVGMKRDVRDNPFNFYKDVFNRYALERSEPLTEVRNIGTINNPIYNAAPASTVDALPTLQRAAAHMMRNRYLGDLQVKSSEFFAQEFGDLLNASRTEIMRDPMRALMDEVNFPFRENIANRDRLAAAKGYRDTARHFLGIRSNLEESAAALEARLADTINSSGSRSPLRLIPRWMMSTIRDPIQAAKNFVYHYQLMNPKQLLTQASGTTMVIAHEGMRTGLQSLPATLRSLAWLKSARTGEILDDFANRMTAFGWKREDFIESHQTMIRTGFHNVGKEYGHRGDIETPLTVRTTGGQALSTGMAPFRWGEEFARIASWHGAYQRWRKRVGPQGVLDDTAVQEILSRADFLNGNMSRAAMANWQRGAGGVTSAFWSYHARVLEQFLDFGPNRLSNLDKAKALMLYGTFWGVPATVGLFAFGFPVIQWVTGKLIDLGITPRLRSESDRTPVEAGADALADVIVNGFLGVGVEAVTGSQFNLSEVYSLGSSRMFTDLISDKSGLEFLFGAYTQSFRDAGNLLNPFLQNFFDLFRTESIAPPVSWRDFSDLIGIQPGINHLQRSYYAITLGRYFDRTGLPLGDMTQFQAWMYALTGAHPQEYSQMYAILNNDRVIREMQQRHLREAQRWFNAMMDADVRNDSAEFERASQRMRMNIILGGFRQDQLPFVMQRLLRGNQDRILQAVRRYGVPGADRERMIQYLLRGQR